MPILKWMVVLMVALPFVQLKAQDTAGKTVKHELASKATGQEYEVFVSLPKNYAANDTARYPVLYVLDGNFMFPIMYETHRLLSEVEEVRDIIIVGAVPHTRLYTYKGYGF
jgi:predicted alpha/beta superfamily hydrolase